MRYRDLQALVYKQETRNLTLHKAQPNDCCKFRTRDTRILHQTNIVSRTVHTKTPHAVILFVLLGFASEIIVSISSKVNIINFKFGRHFGVQYKFHAQ